MLSIKVVFVISVVITIAAAEKVLVGGPKQLSGSDLEVAKETLSNSLRKFANGDGPSYKLGKVISASSQVVSGLLYKFEVELIDASDNTKQCNVQIWQQPWIVDEGVEVTFDCPDGKVVKKHSA